MNESINPFISNFLGPIILIGIILIGFGVMTGHDVSKLLGMFGKLIGSCLMLVMTVLQHTLVFLGRILTLSFKGLTKQVDHAIKQQQYTNNQTQSSTQASPPQNLQPPASGSSSPNPAKPGSTPSTGDIKIIYDNDLDED